MKAHVDGQDYTVPVKVAGRLVTIRDMGKSQFVKILDQQGQIQLYVNRETLRAETLADKAIGYGMPGYAVDGNDILAGTAAAEILVGGLGDDTITGDLGNDVDDGTERQAPLLALDLLQRLALQQFHRIGGLRRLVDVLAVHGLERAHVERRVAARENEPRDVVAVLGVRRLDDRLVGGVARNHIARLNGERRVLSDEIVAIIQKKNKVMAYGTPFWGEFRAEGQNISAPVGGIFSLVQSHEDRRRAHPRLS